jgi:response regulator RpfG family c-di-GMP phosphodiesterase
VPAGTVLNESRKKKLDQVGELYVLRKDVELYKDYTIKNTDASAEGLKGRCRSQFLSLSSSHSDFVFLLIDQSENASFEKGKQLYEKCETLAKDLLTNLSSVNDVADVVNTGSFGDMSPLERSASLAGFAGLASFISSMGDPVQVMVAALLCNIGLLQLSPKITGHLIKHRKADGLSAAEMAEYSRHPALSVEICLSKKLGLVDKLRTILNCTHVRADGKGFPNNVFGEKIPIESQLIHFCEMVDDTYLLGAAEQGKSFVDIRKEIYESEVKNAKIFTIEAMSKIRTWIT